MAGGYNLSMKTIVTIILLSSFVAGAANVRFNLRDFILSSDPLIRKRVEVQPQSSPLASGTNVVLQETRYFNTGASGEFTATNMVEGTYKVVVYGTTRNSIFRINVPDSSNTTNASALLISSANNGLETEDGRSIDLE